MTRILIAYGTSEGQTAKIAECIAGVLRSEGYDAHAREIQDPAALELGDYDGVVIGASVHMGKHQRCVREFVRRNRTALERLPSAFFSVSLAARDTTEPARKEVEGYLQNFVRQTEWRPLRVGVFAGALLYTRYGFFTRWIMKRIARSKGSPDLDTGRDYVYTNWDMVERFAREFLEMVVPQEAPSPSKELVGVTTQNRSLLG